VFEFLAIAQRWEREELGRIVARDYVRGGRADLPRVLAPFAEEQKGKATKVLSLKRQQRVVGE